MGHILEKLGGKAQCGAETGIVNSIPNEPFPSDKLQYFVIRMLIFRENIYSLEQEILMLYPSCWILLTFAKLLEMLREIPAMGKETTGNPTW